MLLAIDVGNTNTVLGVFEGDELAALAGQDRPRATADEIGAARSAGCSPTTPDITGVAVCSTVPAVLREMRTMLERYYADVPTVDRRAGRARPACRCSTTTRRRSAPTASSTPSPRTTCTAARASSSTSARRRTSTSCRPRASSSAARSPRASRSRSTRSPPAAAQLLKVELVKPRSVIGKNTVEALQSGACTASPARSTASCAGSSPSSARSRAVIATGGLAPVVIREQSSTVTVHRPDLTLQGLRLVFDKNT